MKNNPHVSQYQPFTDDVHIISTTITREIWPSSGCGLQDVQILCRAILLLEVERSSLHLETTKTTQKTQEVSLLTSNYIPMID